MIMIYEYEYGLLYMSLAFFSFLPCFRFLTKVAGEITGD